MGTVVPFLLSITLLAAIQSSPVLALTSLSRGGRLYADRSDDVLVSTSRTFSCGFYRMGGNVVSFSIWFSDKAALPEERTVVWSAARDRPMNERRSRAEFWKDGNLVIIDGTDDTLVWSTNNTSPDSNAVELLNTGNLVIRDKRGRKLWQSFDFPTDTLLPGQSLTQDVKLVSSRIHGSVSSGNYNLYFDNDSVLRLMYRDSSITSIYWPTPGLDVFQNRRTNYNSTMLGVLDVQGQFTSSDKFTFAASDMEQRRTSRRLTLDPDGILRLYSFQGRRWAVKARAPVAPCTVHGLCGINGICSYGLSTPSCSCPPGYVMANPTNWKEGCRPLFQSNLCVNDTKRRSQKPTFVEVLHADYYGYDLDFLQRVSLDTCRQKCEDDCRCTAFTYHTHGFGNCYPKAQLHNGYATPDFPGTLYVKVPGDLNVTANLERSKLRCVSNTTEYPITINESNVNRVKWAYIYGFVTLLGVIELLFIITGWWFLFRRPGDDAPRSGSFGNGYQAISDQFRKFTYKELKLATRNFKEELGKGGSGEVYKGVLNNKQVVAVKKLVDVAGRGEEEFRAELSLIGRIYHMNLVRMWGFCLERCQGLLVYEFVENGSLDRHLFHRAEGGNNVLSWSRRFDIAFGTARGLAYLHEECLEWIIHCDIKPENILLDANYQPKIADFGLVKLNERGHPGSNFTRIRGTKGYMAPEWTANVSITAKVDVYSYGVVLLELIRGARISSWVTEGGQELEIRGVVRELKRRLGVEEEAVELLHEFMDPRLDGQFDEVQAWELIAIAVSCLDEERSKRPSMGSVVQKLSTIAHMVEISDFDEMKRQHTDDCDQPLAIKMA